MIEKIKQLARAAGFHQTGVTKMHRLEPGEQALREWTAEGKHGGMKYLEDFDRRKQDFFKDFSDASSVLVLGVIYYSTGERTSGSKFSGKVARLFREGMLNAMQSEFIASARAKGLGEKMLLLKHAVRIAILPVVSYSGPMLADLLTGSFVVESIFQIPGIGVFLVNSAQNRDYTVVVGLSLLYAILLIGLNLIVDFAYTLLDPRVKYE